MKQEHKKDFEWVLDSILSDLRKVYFPKTADLAEEIWDNSVSIFKAFAEKHKSMEHLFSDSTYSTYVYPRENRVYTSFSVVRDETKEWRAKERFFKTEHYRAEAEFIKSRSRIAYALVFNRMDIDNVRHEIGNENNLIISDGEVTLDVRYIVIKSKKITPYLRLVIKEISI